MLLNLQSPPLSKVLPSTQTDTTVIKKACLVMNISRKFTIRTQVCCIGCMWWLAMQRLLYLEHFTDCPRRISTSTCRNSALGSTVETWICLNAWLSRFVAHFYLSKRDNQIQNLPNVVSPKEVQTYFGISRSTTYRIFHDATFPAFHIGNRLLVRRDELLGWLEQQKVNKAQNENPKIVGSDE